MLLQNCYITGDCKYLQIEIKCKVNMISILSDIFLARDQKTFCTLIKQEFSVIAVHKSRQIMNLWYQTLASLKKNFGLGKKETLATWKKC